MKGCLSDRRLWALFEGEGAEGERAHLASCELCETRSRRLTHDLKRLGTVLSDAPPLADVATQTGWGRVRWVAAAAVIVMGLTFAWVREKPAPDRTASALVANMPVLQTLSSEVFSDSGFGSALAPAPLTDLDVLAAAADETVPCEWEPDGCDDETALF
ncbi:MAG: hypothetical protein E6J71_03760 [Deltaproteobacteria bacterium]|nr:MAG: hypothetical protein E6J71_03760 [Deltaproteobacteria bacterium]